MTEYWKQELWRIAIFLVLALVVGAVLGYPFFTLSLVLLGCLSWYVAQGIKLSKWLRSSEEQHLAKPIDSSGAWQRIFSQLWDREHRQRRLNEDIAQQLREYQQVARALPEGAVALGTSGEIEIINEAATQLLGLKDPNDIGRPIHNLIRIPQFISYMDKGDFSKPLEVVSDTGNTKALSISVVPYGNSGKHLLLCRDISRLQRLEEIRRDFIANVSHEMKSPLTVIKGYLETLLDDPVSMQKWEKPLGQIDQQTDRMCAIVEDLLSLSNLETEPALAHSEAVDMPSLIASIHKETQELSQDQHQINMDVDEKLLIVGSFNELYSACSNLVFNAVRYTPDGGQIWIKWFQMEDESACFSVIDNGPGIPAEHIPRLTERFYRVDQARSRELGGTGLGLAIVKHVLLRHDANLAIESKLGSGSTFSCIFPVKSVAVNSSSAA